MISSGQKKARELLGLKNTPKLTGTNEESNKTDENLSNTTFVSRFVFTDIGVGTIVQRTIRPNRPTSAENMNTPFTPKLAAIIGPRTIEMPNDMPIPAPITAIAFDLCSIRVTSDTSANKVLAIAPQPCRNLPRMTPYVLSDIAATCS